MMIIIYIVAVAIAIWLLVALGYFFYGLISGLYHARRRKFFEQIERKKPWLKN